ncbi:hypothetical protein [Curtobacterium sp. ISL-83]|uniref:hypothetical protein n=1 Tax=Curtobacterium sp. ISL-83 TaxID=2819145 RepID=UPI001BEC3DA0|nr:hypothetical protein [Curtobacterium sp. ISL-83]MBT2503095.1 hypothetical protein [Curtobacterium sp. ISL-83]
MEPSRSTVVRRAVRSVLLALLVGAGSAALTWYRLGAVTRATVWAEDGGVFMRERIALGPVASLLHPYAGYLHLLPRLIVDLAWALPVVDYARVVTTASCLVVGVVSGAVFLLARDVVPSPPIRVVLAAIPAVLPLMPYEIGGNTANLHWFMLFTAPWLFAYRARTWWGAAAVAVLALFVVLTELQALFFLPLLLLAWFPLRDRSGRRAWTRALPVTAVALVGLAAQVVAAVTDHRISKPGSPAFGDVLAGWVLQPLAGAWDPDVGAVLATVVAHGWAVVLVPAVAVVVVVLVAVLVAPLRARWLILALAVVSGGVWWAALLANGGAAQPWSQPTAAMVAVPPQRYAAAAGMLLVAAVVVAAGVLVDARNWSVAVRRRTRPGGATRLVGAVAGWCLVAAVVTSAVLSVGPGVTRRSHGPVWAGQIPAAVAMCRAHPSAVAQVKTAPWAAQVPCGEVLGH